MIHSSLIRFDQAAPRLTAVMARLKIEQRSVRKALRALKGPPTEKSERSSSQRSVISRFCDAAESADKATPVSALLAFSVRVRLVIQVVNMVEIFSL